MSVLPINTFCTPLFLEIILKLSLLKNGVNIMGSFFCGLYKTQAFYFHLKGLMEIKQRKNSPRV